MKKIFIIIPIILSLVACSTPRTILKHKNGQIAVCGGDMSSSAAAGAIGYYLQKQVDKECVEAFKNNGFKVTEKEE